MTNYYATARTNYVTPTDQDALKTSIKGFNILVSGESTSDKVCLISEEEDGWSLSRKKEEEGSGLQEEPQQSEVDEGTAFASRHDDYEEFSFEEHVMPFVKEGEVLVAMEAGNEKHRYVVGVAQAFVREGEEVKFLNLILDDVYELAAKQFNKSIGDITRAMY